MKIETKQVLAIILPLLFFSIFVSSAVISLMNDMYAFVKPDTEITLSISEHSTVKDVSYLLAKEGIVKNPFVFSAYVNYKEKTHDVEAFCGEITLNSNLSYREILFLFVN